MSLVFTYHQNILHTKSFVSLRLDICLHKPLESRVSHLFFSLVPNHSHRKLCLGGTKFEPIIKMGHNFYPGKTSVVVDEYQQDLPNEDDDGDIWPVECVREFKTDEEFGKILNKSKGTGNSGCGGFLPHFLQKLQVYRTRFCKLCRKSGSHDAPVIFLKHNVTSVIEPDDVGLRQRT